jgi:hypothetical protein
MGDDSKLWRKQRQAGLSQVVITASALLNLRIKPAVSWHEASLCSGIIGSGADAASQQRKDRKRGEPACTTMLRPDMSASLPSLLCHLLSFIIDLLLFLAKTKYKRGLCL